MPRVMYHNHKMSDNASLLFDPRHIFVFLLLEQSFTLDQVIIIVITITIIILAC